MKSTPPWPSWGLRASLFGRPCWRGCWRGTLARRTIRRSSPAFISGDARFAFCGKGSRRLGWSRSDEGNFCTVVEPGARSPSLSRPVPNIRAVPVARRRRPSAGKGRSTAEAVHTNAQLYLFQEFAPAVPAEPDRATWVLLFHSDGKEIRAELSLPDSIGDDGHINGWRERIILGAQPLDDEIAPAAPDFGPDPTIDVRRKA